jgi:histidyl-tRNA synthetase
VKCLKLLTLTLLFCEQVLFARYIARRGISQMKRYSFDKVYRENRLVSALGLHPREITACSFDIVTPVDAVDTVDTDDILEASKLMPETEVLMAVFEIIKEFPLLAARNYFIRFNHTRLLKAVMLHSGITDHHNEVIAILNDAKVKVCLIRTQHFVLHFFFVILLIVRQQGVIYLNI